MAINGSKHMPKGRMWFKKKDIKIWLWFSISDHSFLNYSSHELWKWMKFGAPIQTVLVSMRAKFCEVRTLHSQNTGQNIIMGHMQKIYTCSNWQRQRGFKILLFLWMLQKSHVNQTGGLVRVWSFQVVTSRFRPSPKFRESSLDPSL